MTLDWVNRAIQLIEADFNRSADTHLIRLEVPGLKNTTLYLKDESTHPSGSLKHRLARSLFLYGLCNGHIHEDTTIVESSSGSTAVSEAYFARLLGLSFIAVMPHETSREKIDQVEFYGGQCHFVDACQVYAEAQRLAEEKNGHYMDQFTYAERATDWRGNNNIAESIFTQMSSEAHCIPTWIVMSAGTGGTSATIGRYIRYCQYPCKLCVADPDNSVFYDFYHSGDSSLTLNQASRIGGIGRPRVEPSFIPSVIDRMIKVPDGASFATLGLLERLLYRKCGPSTGTNIYAALQIALELEKTGEQHSIVTLICDSGDCYLKTCYNPDWLKENGIDLAPYSKELQKFM